MATSALLTLLGIFGGARELFLAVLVTAVFVAVEAFGLPVSSSQFVLLGGIASTPFLTAIVSAELLERYSLQPKSEQPHFNFGIHYSLPFAGLVMLQSGLLGRLVADAFAAVQSSGVAAQILLFIQVINCSLIAGSTIALFVGLICGIVELPTAWFASQKSARVSATVQAVSSLRPILTLVIVFILMQFVFSQFSRLLTESLLP